jgi:carbon storage regulator
MLVMSRKKNESIVINENITVTVVEIRGDKVRLGIVVPKEVPVHRQEVWDAIHGRESLLMEPLYVAPAPAGAAPVAMPAEPPAVRITDPQAILLDRLAAALEARTGAHLDRHGLAQTIIDVSLKQLQDDADALKR